MAQNQRPPEQDAREPRQPRHSVRIKALLDAYGTCRSIEIIDYSRHGFRLEHAFGIDPGQRVTVELRSGLRLPMIVLWVERGQAGVRFLGPIAPGHTVMRSLEQAARKYKLPCAAVHE